MSYVLFQPLHLIINKTKQVARFGLKAIIYILPKLEYTTAAQGNYSKTHKQDFPLFMRVIQSIFITIVVVTAIMESTTIIRSIIVQVTASTKAGKGHQLKAVKCFNQEEAAIRVKFKIRVGLDQSICEGTSLGLQGLQVRVLIELRLPST